MGVVLVYDITDSKSFNEVRFWMKSIEENSPKDIKVFLVGNKSDRTSERKVMYEDGESAAKSLGIKFFEVSAKANTNVDNLFTEMAQDVKRSRIGSGTETSSGGSGGFSVTGSNTDVITTEDIKKSDKKKGGPKCCN